MNIKEFFQELKEGKEPKVRYNVIVNGEWVASFDDEQQAWDVAIGYQNDDSGYYGMYPNAYVETEYLDDESLEENLQEAKGKKYFYELTNEEKKEVLDVLESIVEFIIGDREVSTYLHKYGFQLGSTEIPPISIWEESGEVRIMLDPEINSAAARKIINKIKKQFDTNDLWIYYDKNDGSYPQEIVIKYLNDGKNENLNEDLYEFSKADKKAIIQWWKDISKIEDNYVNISNIDKALENDDEFFNWFSAMYDVLNDLRYNFIEKDDNKREYLTNLYRKGKRLYNKYALSQFNESIEDSQDEKVIRVYKLITKDGEYSAYGDDDKYFYNAGDELLVYNSEYDEFNDLGETFEDKLDYCKKHYSDSNYEIWVDDKNGSEHKLIGKPINYKAWGFDEYGYKLENYNKNLKEEEVLGYSCVVRNKYDDSLVDARAYKTRQEAYECMTWMMDNREEFGGDDVYFEIEKLDENSSYADDLKENLKEDKELKDYLVRTNNGSFKLKAHNDKDALKKARLSQDDQVEKIVDVKTNKVVFELEENLKEAKGTIPEKANLKKILDRYDSNGKFAKQGNWKIARGGYDLAFQLYYDNLALIDGIKGEWDTNTRLELDQDTYGANDEYNVKDLANYICQVYKDCKLDENLNEAKGKLDDALPELKDMINEHKNSIIEYGEALKQGNVKNPNYKNYTTRFVFDVYYFLKGRGFNIYEYIDENDLKDSYIETLMKKALSDCGIKVSLEEDLDTFNDKMNFLAKDEDEAIDGYKKVIKTIDDKNVKTQLKKIETEEKAHKDYLERVKKNKNTKYTEPLMDEE